MEGSKYPMELIEVCASWLGHHSYKEMQALMKIETCSYPRNPVGPVEGSGCNSDTVVEDSWVEEVGMVVEKVGV